MKDLAKVTRRVSAILATAEGLEHGPIGKHRQDVKIEPQSRFRVRDFVNWELREQAAQQESEYLEENDTFTPAELTKGRKTAREGGVPIEDQPRRDVS